MCVLYVRPCPFPCEVLLKPGDGFPVYPAFLLHLRRIRAAIPPEDMALKTAI